MTDFKRAPDIPKIFFGKMLKPPLFGFCDWDHIFSKASTDYCLVSRDAEVFLVEELPKFMPKRILKINLIGPRMLFKLNILPTIYLAALKALYYYS